MSRSVRKAASCAALLGALLVAPACGPARPEPARPVARVLIVGMDGLEWSVLRPLLAEGRCPNLRALMERGSFGRLATLNRTLSPVVWTSIATGRLPREHGIMDFLDPQGGVYTSSDRLVPALWNLADWHGLTTNMVGWFITWPAEEVAGLVVSGSSSAAMTDANWKPALAADVPGQVHPPEREAEVLALAARVSTQQAIARIAREKVFGPLPAGLLDAAEEKVKQQTLWSLAADETYFRIAEQALREHPADLNLVYLGGTDVVGHRYWRQYRPGPFKWGSTPEADAALARVLPDYYVWADEMLGALIAAAGEGPLTVLVVSDHGMHEISTEAPNEAGMTGHHLDAPPGVIVAAGPGIAKGAGHAGGVQAFLDTGALPVLGTVLDVAPTVLALLGIPGAKDMAGRAFVALLEPGPALDAARAPLVPSWDAIYEPAPRQAVSNAMDESFREKFGQLGYLALELDPSEHIDVVLPAAGEPDGGDGAGGR